MRRSYLAILPAILIWAVLVGMAQGPAPEVPTPEINFKATIKDDQDIDTKVQNASWEGNVFFSGTRGTGVVTISFGKVKKVTSVGSGSETRKDFQITLRNGNVVAVSFDVDSRFFGTTDFGTYRIKAKNIQEITFE